MAEVVCFLKDKELFRTSITKPTMVMGRDSGCDIVIDNLAVSREHFHIHFREGQFILKDLGSANGTLINGAKASEKVLTNNDRIGVGKYIMLFKRSEEESLASAKGEAPSEKHKGPKNDLATLFMDTESIAKAKESLQKEAARRQIREAEAREAAAERKSRTVLFLVLGLVLILLLVAYFASDDLIALLRS